MTLSTLSHIYTLQEAYKLESQEYRNFNPVGHDACSNGNSLALGLEFVPCDATKGIPRYNYNANRNGGTSFRAVANSRTGADNTVCPGDTSAHYFGIDHARTLIFSTAAITGSGALTANNTPGRCN